jgi:membrane-associated phospholipid phosphatase
MTSAVHAVGSQVLAAAEFPDSGLYRGVVEFANSTPSFIRTLASLGTEGGLVVLFGLFVAAWWYARSGTPRQMAQALLGPALMVFAYGLSELSKSVINEDRPCRAMKIATIEQCPPLGDWSFPSNHSVLAASMAVGLFLAWRILAAAAIPLALGVAFSRVFIGVHYPHDVVAGLLFGTAVVLLTHWALLKPATAIVDRLREIKPLDLLLGTTSGSRLGKPRRIHSAPSESGGGWATTYSSANTPARSARAGGPRPISTGGPEPIPDPVRPQAPPPRPPYEPEPDDYHQPLPQQNGPTRTRTLPPAH